MIGNRGFAGGNRYGGGGGIYAGKARDNDGRASSAEDWTIPLPRNERVENELFGKRNAKTLSAGQAFFLI